MAITYSQLMGQRAGAQPRSLSVRPVRPVAPIRNQRQLETAGNAAPYGVSNFTYGQSSPVSAPPTAQPQAQSSYDYSADPVLQSVRAAGARSRSDAEAAALAARKRLAILFGDASGIVDDAGTADAARGNTFSTLAEINRGYQRGAANLDDALNKRNLFYSGYRGQELARALEDKQRQEYGARNSLQDALLGVNRDLAAALSEQQARDAQAENDAANRALQVALDYGINPGPVQPQIGTAISTPDLSLALANSYYSPAVGTKKKMV